MAHLAHLARTLVDTITLPLRLVLPSEVLDHPINNTEALTELSPASDADSRLPAEMWLAVCSHLDTPALGRLALVDRYFSQLTRTSSLWRTRLYLDFPELSKVDPLALWDWARSGAHSWRELHQRLSAKGWTHPPTQWRVLRAGGVSALSRLGGGLVLALGWRLTLRGLGLWTPLQAALTTTTLLGLGAWGFFGGVHTALALAPALTVAQVSYPLPLLRPPPQARTRYRFLARTSKAVLGVGLLGYLGGMLLFVPLHTLLWGPLRDQLVLAAMLLLPRFLARLPLPPRTLALLPWITTPALAALRLAL